MIFTEQEQRRIVQAAQSRLERCLPELNLAGGCLYATTSLFIELMDLKIKDLRVMPLAGSLYWQIVAPEDDDGVSPTHWSMVWSPTELPSLMTVNMGHLPEMHVWLAIGLGDELECIDINTKHFPALCEQTAGLHLTGPVPDFLWTKVEEGYPDGVYYVPNESATALVLSLMKQSVLSRLQ